MSPSACRCGSCPGTRSTTPARIWNRPALPALQYRAGTYDQFLTSMLAGLSSTDHSSLAGLTTREPDDPSIALMEGWALIADILTFYQERIVNEGYLRTATEQESLVRLGRLVGHRPRPPLAAGTFLAYTLDAGTRCTIPAGSQVKSAPPPGGLPQVFETSEELNARAEWNQLPVRATVPPSIDPDAAEIMPSLELDGVQPNLGAGDRLLFTFGDPTRNITRLVESTRLDPYRRRTTVLLKAPGPAHQLKREVQAFREDVDKAVRKPQPSKPFEDFLRVLREVLHAGDILRDPDALAETLDDKLQAFRERLSGAQADAAHAAELLDKVTARVAAVRTAAGAVTGLPTGTAGKRSPSSSDGEPSVNPLSLGRQVLHGLERPPSRPPRNPSEMATPVTELFSPDSDAMSRLLTAKSPHLAETLYRALGTVSVSAADPPGVQCFRVKAAPLGATIPDVASVRRLLRSADSGDPPGPDESTDDGRVLLLDSVYDTILPGTWIAVRQTDGHTKTRIIQVTDVTQLAVADEHYAARVTRLRLAEPWTDDPDDLSARRATTVWAAGETLALADPPDTSVVAGDAIELAGAYEGLTPGRWLIVSGERTDIPNVSGVQGTELVMLGGVHQGLDDTPFGHGVRSTLALTTELAYRYRRDTVVIHGNVVLATAGETRNEILGSGDATQAGQVFPLRQGPLTWLPARTPDGARETLTVRVSGVEWPRIADLNEADPATLAYRLRVGIDGGTAVEFGDGRHGSRLPTGVENVTAHYRIGGGTPGNVAAGQVNHVVSRPLGVSGVTNPLPATGGTDADGREEARRSIPLRLSALDRLVSVRDYEDFALAFAGIGKAVARRCPDGARQFVHVTVDAADNAPLDARSLLLDALQSALSRYGDPALPVRVEVCERVRLVLSLGVRTLPDHSRDVVEQAVRDALLDRLGFAAAELAQPVFLSAAIAAAQAVPGVDFVDVDAFGGVGDDVDAAGVIRFARELTAAPCVPGHPAGYRETLYTPAPEETSASVAAANGLTEEQLALLNPDGVPRTPGTAMVVRRALRPAQLVLLDSSLPETLVLRRMP
ncbi:putative baseplate assembly protein [Streptomyces sp. NBC_01280]|uniref:putative baseplate assembly protein n=1 Tax=Streptomyces sp. NBC_01280 TaxID=2903810 RepID=UPI002E35D7A1|nr:putative baseplate assembly protein [Streptomyces sp. NBC_01280]